MQRQAQESRAKGCGEAGKAAAESAEESGHARGKGTLRLGESDPEVAKSVLSMNLVVHWSHQPLASLPPAALLQRRQVKRLSESLFIYALHAWTCTPLLIQDTIAEWYGAVAL
mmetsp:Transcript_61496/g.109427  ORF Transcript_61496/g.109427 Transcript_61496/m.109427 type:complete len:113 (-) Transcript_61496:90-428(-)